MAADDAGRDSGFLRRWSKRKLAAAREAAPEPEAVDKPPDAVPPTGVAAEVPTTADAPPGPVAPAAESLPDVDSLSFESDFRAFLSPKVDEGTRRAALRKLFSDPRFNAMDGLDVYIDDYTKFEPITPEVLKQLAHARYLFDPPKTRVNEQGHVEDVVDEAQAAAPAEGTQDADRADVDAEVAASGDGEALQTAAAPEPSDPPAGPAASPAQATEVSTTPTR